MLNLVRLEVVFVLTAKRLFLIKGVGVLHEQLTDRGEILDAYTLLPIHVLFF